MSPPLLWRQRQHRWRPGGVFLSGLAAGPGLFSAAVRSQPLRWQVIKICNLILKSPGIKLLRHWSAEWGNGGVGIDKSISCLSLQLAAEPPSALEEGV